MNEWMNGHGFFNTNSFTLRLIECILKDHRISEIIWCTLLAVFLGSHACISQSSVSYNLHRKKFPLWLKEKDHANMRSDSFLIGARGYVSEAFNHKENILNVLWSQNIIPPGLEEAHEYTSRYWYISFQITLKPSAAENWCIFQQWVNLGIFSVSVSCGKNFWSWGFIFIPGPRVCSWCLWGDHIVKLSLKKSLYQRPHKIRE